MSAAVNFNDIPYDHRARNLYWAGYSLTEITEVLDINYNTLASRKKRERWDYVHNTERLRLTIHSRYIQLTIKESKTESDYREIENLGREIERLSRIQQYEQSGNQAKLNPNLSQRRKGKKLKRNQITEEHIDQLKEAFFDRIFPHQRIWYDAGLEYTIREIVKSRQIGATFYFSLEALIRALETGVNQIFISASRNQALVFRRNIVKFVKDVTGIELKGDPIVLPNGAELLFLGTNKNTVQSYSGDLYIDEYFWIPKFADIEHVASGMCVLDNRRITYFSTPSSVDHPAYNTWSGEHYNQGRRKSDKISLDVSHKALKHGRLCEDGHWRQIVTIEDAINSGYDLVTMEKLRQKFPPLKFDNLLMAKFVDSTACVFTLADMLSCTVDPLECWDDYNPCHKRPLKGLPVWIGYDPSRSRDDACIVVIAPPKVPGGRFRLIEKITMNDKGYEYQVKQIRNLTKKYNVEHIGIDANGMGDVVHELTMKFFPAAKKILYSVENKNRLVLKAQHFIKTGRFEYDCADKDLPLAFMTIHRSLTPGGGKITYSATRTDKTGHADEAWAVMHALDNEPLKINDEEDEESNTSESCMELC